jgi:hypothetical protein
MIDCGADWLREVHRLAPDAIVLTHAHPDHVGGLRNGSPSPVYAPATVWQAIASWVQRAERDCAIPRQRPHAAHECVRQSDRWGLRIAPLARRGDTVDDVLAYPGKWRRSATHSKSRNDAAKRRRGLGAQARRAHRGVCEPRYGSGGCWRRTRLEGREGPRARDSDCDGRRIPEARAGEVRGGDMAGRSVRS